MKRISTATARQRDAKYDQTVQGQNFFQEVGSLRGPGSEKIKAEVVLMINSKIETTEKSSINGRRRPYAGMYKEVLITLLRSDAPGIFRALENEPALSKQVSGMIDNLIRHSEGQIAIGEMVAEMVTTTARQLLKSPLENRDAAKAFGYFMNHIIDGIERNAKDKADEIETLKNLVVTTFKSVADPFSNLASRSGNDQMLENYEIALDVFHQYYQHR